MDKDIGTNMPTLQKTTTTTTTTTRVVDKTHTPHAAQIRFVNLKKETSKA